MRKRQLRTIVKSMHNLNKKASELNKQSRMTNDKAVDEFFELVFRLCEKYNVKCLADVDEYSFEKSELKYIIPSKTAYPSLSTYFNRDFEGEFSIVFVGKLSLKQINEIKNLTGAFTLEELAEENGYYSFYQFLFDFMRYYNESYQ